MQTFHRRIQRFGGKTQRSNGFIGNLCRQTQRAFNGQATIAKIGAVKDFAGEGFRRFGFSCSRLASTVRFLLRCFLKP